MSAYPACNATLTAIRTPGVPDEYGDPGAGTVVWEGQAPGYLKRQRATRLGSGAGAGRGAGAGTRVDDAVDVFWLLASDGAFIADRTGITNGHQVTILDQRTTPAVAREFRLTMVENRAAGTIADNQRWELDPVVVGA